MNDLLVEEYEKPLFADKIKCVSINSYKEAVDFLSFALNRKQKRKTNINGIISEESQSHVFITLEITQQAQFTKFPSEVIKSKNKKNRRKKLF